MDDQELEDVEEEDEVYATYELFFRVVLDLITTYLRQNKN
jgi:hypothetical protein